MKTIKPFLSLLLVCIGCAICGWATYKWVASVRTNDNENIFHVSPNHLVFVESYIEGEHVKAPFMLVNPTAVPVRVLELLPSCNCGQIRLKHGKNADEAFVIGAGESVPFQLIDTTGMIGNKSVQIFVVCEQNGNRRVVDGWVTMTVRPNFLSHFSIDKEPGHVEKTVESRFLP